MNMAELKQIQFTRETNIELERISKLSGLEREKIIAKAVYYYLNVIKQDIELKEEFEELDKLSDEALDNFEAKL